MDVMATAGDSARLLYERTGSYDIVWWLAVAFGILSAVINLPIEEKPVLRAQAAAA